MSRGERPRSQLSNPAPLLLGVRVGTSTDGNWRRLDRRARTSLSPRRPYTTVLAAVLHNSERQRGMYIRERWKGGRADGEVGRGSLRLERVDCIYRYHHREPFWRAFPTGPRGHKRWEIFADRSCQGTPRAERQNRVWWRPAATGKGVLEEQRGRRERTAAGEVGACSRPLAGVRYIVILCYQRRYDERRYSGAEKCDQGRQHTKGRRTKKRCWPIERAVQRWGGSQAKRSPAKKIWRRYESLAGAAGTVG